MRQLAARLGIDVDEHRWPRLLQAATLESMRRMAATIVPGGGPEHWIDPAAYFSRGTSGQWRDLLDDADLARYAARVRALASDILVEWVHRGADRLRSRPAVHPHYPKLIVSADHS